MKIVGGLSNSPSKYQMFSLRESTSLTDNTCDDFLWHTLSLRSYQEEWIRRQTLISGEKRKWQESFGPNTKYCLLMKNAYEAENSLVSSSLWNWWFSGSKIFLLRWWNICSQVLKYFFSGAERRCKVSTRGGTPLESRNLWQYCQCQVIMMKKVIVMMILMRAATCANIVNIRCNEDGDDCN